MPCLKILTNVPTAKIPVDFCKKITPIMVETVKKETEHMMCVISGDCQVSFGGDSSAPAAVATLESIGNLGVEENKYIVKELANFMHKEIGVTPDRFFISFYDIRGYNVGRFGITFDNL
ncbi:macrophage migration inhibitory factor-like [Amyelois transitella]|uniref:macrophage migration inhibitory factor-like n=1 Tax=Amyelois transitella TaxID=680683 RepID=UPI00299039C9|nr:macrophage migration inhibitory factor-like [Amyelois transitella]